MFFNFKPKGTVQYLIAGLGNPTPKYENNRHNAGYKAVDFLAKKLGLNGSKTKFKAITFEGDAGGSKCLFLKPLTFMNLSGEAVGAAARFYKIPPERVLVIFDDVSLDVGKIRIRKKGSDGGHNGIKSIIEHLNSEDFPRIKIGVGKKPHPDYDLAKWVLSDFKKEELDLLGTSLEKSYEAAIKIVGGGIDSAMNEFNNK